MTLTAVSLYSGADNLGDGFHQAGGKSAIKKQIGNALPAAITKAFFEPVIRGIEIEA